MSGSERKLIIKIYFTYLTTLATVFFPTYDSLDVRFIGSWM